ncbi:MAG: heme-binding protein [Candidatus Paceibacterota bacterium]
MKINLIILSIIVGLLIIWSIVGYFTSSAEQAKYSVLKKADGYEIRNYSAHIVAQTIVEGTSVNGDAFNNGFTIIAGYIFGGNVKKESIAMTAPVVVQEASEKIAMTVPVTASATGDSQIVSFVMPSRYTLETLPTPNDPRIKLAEVPEQKMAALRFSWYRTDSRFEKMQKQLFADLARDNITIIGTPIYAGYNPPWTPPWMNRNEIMVQVQ